MSDTREREIRERHEEEEALIVPEGPALDETMLEIVEAKERADLIDGAELRQRIERLIGRQPKRSMFPDFGRGRTSGFETVLSMIDELAG